MASESIIQDLFYEENLYQVSPESLSAAPVLEPSQNSWRVIPYATDGSGRPSLTLYLITGKFITRTFRKEDIRTMKLCALEWLGAIRTRAESVRDPWWKQFQWLKQHSTRDLSSCCHEPAPTDEALEDYWNLFLSFLEHQYVCGRYYYQQYLLFVDLERDSLALYDFFPFTCEKVYYFLMLRVAAAHLGDVMRNIQGD